MQSRAATHDGSGDIARFDHAPLVVFLGTRMHAAITHSVRICALALGLQTAEAGAQSSDLSSVNTIPPSTRGESGRRLSIRQAIALAQPASDDVQRARATESFRQGTLRAARSGYFPVVVVTGSYDRQLKSEYDGLFTAPSGADAGVGADLRELPFGSKNTYRFGGTIAQNLYAGGQTRASVRQASAALEAAGIGLTSARAQAVLDVASAYYDAVLADRLVVIAQAAREQAEETLRDVRLGYEAGTRPEFDVVRARVSVESSKPVVIRQELARTLAYLRLRQLLELPDGESLTLTTGLGEEPPMTPAEQARMQARIGKTTAADRAPVRQAEQALRANDAAVSIARSGYLPSVDANMTYGRVAYPSDAPAWDDFRTNWFVGLSLSWTLFDGFRTSGNVRAAQGARDESLADLNKARKLAVYEAIQAAQEVASARAVWQATASTTEEATRAYDIAKVRFEAGVSTQLELLDARLRVVQTHADRARAARDVQVAQIRLALLPALPFATLSPDGRAAPNLASPAVEATPSMASSPGTAPASPERALVP